MLTPGLISEIFLSTPSARRATLQGRPSRPSRKISIHALREEGDAVVNRAVAVQDDFYPRPPRGGRLSGLSGSSPGSSFLSTPSARRATFVFVLVMVDESRFLSTPSARRATMHSQGGSTMTGISIHALREEGDDPVPTNECLYDDFYPRPPRGGRHGLGGLNPVGTRFLSTPSARRATYPRCSPCGWSAISIHALREEGDSGSAASKTTRKTFLSTPSARRATSLT